MGYRETESSHCFALSLSLCVSRTELRKNGESTRMNVLDVHHRMNFFSVGTQSNGIWNIRQIQDTGCTYFEFEKKKTNAANHPPAKNDCVKTEWSNCIQKKKGWMFVRIFVFVQDKPHDVDEIEWVKDREREKNIWCICKQNQFALKTETPSQQRNSIILELLVKRTLYFLTLNQCFYIRIREWNKNGRNKKKEEKIQRPSFKKVHIHKM